MLDHMKALQIMFYPIPKHEKEEAAIRQMRCELRQKLDFGGRALEEVPPDDGTEDD